MKLWLPVLFLSAPLLGCVSDDTDSRGQAIGATAPTVDIQLLNVSDWHGQLDPQTFGGVRVGGASVLSAYWKLDRAANPASLTLTAGDAFGATPPLSNFFDDEPAILAQNLMGFDVDTFGNHNFDRGLTHLQSLIDLSTFDHVAANLRHVEGNLSGVAPWQMYELGGAKVAVVGIVNPEAPTLVKPGMFGPIEVTDPVPAANHARAEALAAGADVVVAITHLGVTSFDAAGNPAGPLVDFANAVGGFDVIYGDHTDIAYSGVINNALVLECNSKGVNYGRIRLRVDTRAHRVVERSGSLVVPLVSAVTPDPAIEAMLAPYRAQLSTVLKVQVGASNVAIPRADACGNGLGRLCESKVGDVAADSLRLGYGTDFALTNSGGLRAALTCPAVDDPNDFCEPFTAPPYPITRGQVFTVLPFGNEVATLTITGAELKAMLENGVSRVPAADGRFPQVSGLCFRYDVALPAGSRVLDAVRQAADGSCAGEPVDLTAATSYTLASNDFTLSGGDGYPNLSARMTTREMMDEAVTTYIGERTPIGPSIQGRIQCTTSNPAVACPVITAP